MTSNNDEDKLDEILTEWRFGGADREMTRKAINKLLNEARINELGRAAPHMLKQHGRSLYYDERMEALAQQSNEGETFVETAEEDFVVSSNVASGLKKGDPLVIKGFSDNDMEATIKEITPRPDGSVSLSLNKLENNGGGNGKANSKK